MGCPSATCPGQQEESRSLGPAQLRLLHSQLSAAHSLRVSLLFALTKGADSDSKPPPAPTPAGHSVDPGSAGLLGRRAPRSKQPFMVTFFRASSSPARVPRAAKPPRRRQQPRKGNDLPHPNKLPGIFGESFVG